MDALLFLSCCGLGAGFLGETDREVERFLLILLVLALGLGRMGELDLDGLVFFCCMSGLFLGGDFDLERDVLRFMVAAAGGGRLLFLGGE